MLNARGHGRDATVDATGAGGRGVVRLAVVEGGERAVHDVQVPPLLLALVAHGELAAHVPVLLLERATLAPDELRLGLRGRLQSHGVPLRVEHASAVRTALGQASELGVGDEDVLAAVPAVVHRDLRVVRLGRVLAGVRVRRTLRHRGRTGEGGGVGEDLPPARAGVEGVARGGDLRADEVMELALGQIV